VNKTLSIPLYLLLSITCSALPISHVQTESHNQADYAHLHTTMEKINNYISEVKKFFTKFLNKKDKTQYQRCSEEFAQLLHHMNVDIMQPLSAKKTHTDALVYSAMKPIYDSLQEISEIIAHYIPNKDSSQVTAAFQLSQALFMAKNKLKGIVSDTGLPHLEKVLKHDAGNDHLQEHVQMVLATLKKLVSNDGKTMSPIEAIAAIKYRLECR
jgi:hypothetical protein